MDPLTMVGLLVSLVSLAYAYKTNRDKARLEKTLRISFHRLRTSVDNVKANAKLAYDHLDGIRRFAQDLPPSPERATVLDHIAWLHGDVTATERLLKAVRADLDSVSQGLFDADSAARNQQLPPGSREATPTQQQTVDPDPKLGGVGRTP